MVKLSKNEIRFCIAALNADAVALREAAAEFKADEAEAAAAVCITKAEANEHIANKLKAAINEGHKRIAVVK